MNTHTRFLSGKSGAIAVYWFFRLEMPGPGSDEDDSIRISKWTEAIPDSDYAKFGALRLMYAEAWNARGSKYASDTNESQFRRFYDRLLETESEILSRESRILDTPIAQNLLLAVILDSPAPQSDASEVFASAVQKWPEYYDFYEIVITRLVPKWGGSWEAVDGFIRFWSKAREETEGDSLYARLYYFVHSRRNEISDTRVDWPTLRSSLKTLVDKYPATEHWNVAASYACRYGDKDFYIESTDAGARQTAPFTADLKFGYTQEYCDEHYSISR